MPKAGSKIGATIFSDLKADVLSGRLQPNERLNIDAIRERYDVSLSPLREALARLVSTGLIVVGDRRGYRVAGLSRDDLRDIGRTRRHIERAALADALKYGDDDWEADIARALHVLSKATTMESGRVVYTLEWETRHKAFHRTLISGCGSARLIEIWDNIYDQGIRYRQIAEALGLYHGDSAAEHAQLFRLATERDEKRAIECIDAHVGVAVNVLVETMDEEILECAERIAALKAEEV